MWNSWVENAKAMAADLDSKINESVGLDSNGNAINTSAAVATPTVSASSKLIPTSSFETPLAATPAANATKIEDDGDDAWNDDFDFDDDDENAEDSPPVESTTPIKSIEPIATTPQATIRAISETATPAVAPTQVALPEESPAQASTDASPTTPDPIQSPTISSQNDGGWDGEDDLDVELDDEVFEGDAKTQETNPSVATPAAKPITSVATPTSGGAGLFSNLSSLTKTADALLTPIATTEKSEEKEDGNLAAKSTIESPDSKIKAKSDSMSTPVPKATPQTKGAAQTPMFTPGGSLFSRMTNLAQTADSLLTAAVEQSVGVDDNKVLESSEPIDSGGWEEDNDDDFFDDEEKEDDNIAEEVATSIDSAANDFPSSSVDPEGKPKAEESTASFVKVSPTSSLSTPEIVVQKAPIPNLPTLDSEKTTADPTSPAALQAESMEAPSTSPMVSATNIEDDPRFQKLQETLRLREEQLMAKGTQLNELQLLLETRDEQHKKKLLETKEEAKKRILRAKERCEAAEAKLATRASGASDDIQKKQLIIDELMEEGQALAKKQSVMERAVRDATAETRAITAELQQETEEKEQAKEKIKELEATCKSLKESLTSARKGESQAGKLENDLLSARADAEEKANTILSLQQRLKELSAESKDLQQEIDETRKSAAHEAQQEKTSMRKEHNDLIGDLEQKLRTTEREAGVREDALRHEISEIRKRWQDSVRRADALSMDIQSSTAPLLRQLESMERQNRLRATNSAELESRLRSDLEEAVVENERLGKESSEFRSKLSKLERSVKDRDQELSKAKATLSEQARDLENLRNQEEKLIAEAEAKQVEYEKVERLANEGVARVRSEMSKTVTDSEERYRGQIDKLQNELAVEKDKREQLEAQVGQLLESGGGLFAASQALKPMVEAPNALGIKRESKPKKLHKAENQAEILAGALGLGEDSSDDESNFDSDDDIDMFDEGKRSGGQPSGGGNHSFAAIEQLSSKLKTSEVELKSMRKSLKESNEIRQSLVEELGEARAAKEKLPLFEAKVKELTQENQALEMEIAGLKDDIADVRDLYRTQLNVLLEEKTASANNQTQEGADESDKAST